MLTMYSNVKDPMMMVAKDIHNTNTSLTRRLHNDKCGLLGLLLVGESLLLRGMDSLIVNL